ncbi:MAG: Panacea domain-containing protein [Chloroflexota bacterium]|nr:Panacea domain-containing protein [Chloroflexota bacterium]
MKFVFDERKAAQAAAHLLHRNGEPMPYIKLIKLLYLADRRAFVETGYPITGDRLVSMKNGPVLSNVLDLIRLTGGRDRSVWHEYVSDPDAHAVRAIGPAELDEADDELSEYERSLLDAVFQEFGGANEWDLVDHTHTLPEWTDPKGSSAAIDPKVILKSEGFTKKEVAAVESEVTAFHDLHKRYLS